MKELSNGFTNGEVSYWFRDTPRPVKREPLPGDTQVDVAIAGAGMTGLWLAYYLSKANSELNIAVLEKEFAGFGASGRNAGWLSGESPGQLRRYAAKHGWDEAKRLQREVFDTIDEVIRVLDVEGVDADLAKDGLMYVARSPSQLKRLHEAVAGKRKQGWGEEDLVVLSGRDVQEEIAVDGARGGYWTPHCARVQPAKMVNGLAQVVERQGVCIYENTEVTEISPRTMKTNRGVVTARVVVNALEGFDSQMPGHRRRRLPMNSSMIITEPLGDDVWARIGWKDGRTLADRAHSYSYSQRTVDGRIAIGGRGVPYYFGSTFDPSGKTPNTTIEQLRRYLNDILPETRGTGIDHAWSGILGVPRDWTAAVTFDPKTGMGESGGYTGHGVAGTNLGARTLADLILERDTPLTRLPWVGWTARNWEPEPLRFIGARSLYVAYRFADRQENASSSGRTSPVAHLADWISGRH